jgi:hypothetical protein
MRRWDWLEDLIKKNGWTAGAELGVLKGQTYLHLLRTCPELTLIGVDLWADQPNTPGQEDKIGRDFDGMLANIKQQSKGYGDRARTIRDFTVDAASQVADGTLDFVFVDADHSSDAVRADIIAWQPKLKPEGKMLGHDINWESVRSVVAELFDGYTIHPDNCWMESRSLRKEA